VAARLAQEGIEVTVLEKERRVASHQTGRNSGVIHSGIYYTPGSLKAQLCRAGVQSMKRFTADHGIPMETTGKLIVATTEAQVPALRRLAGRAVQNHIEATELTPAQAQRIEPHVRAELALHVPETGITDYSQVCRVLADQVTENSGHVELGTAFRMARTSQGRVHVATSGSDRVADVLVNCGGLQSDLIASACGLKPNARIVPFRGEYFELVESRRSLVRGLIYPVPDPRFPFLGVHLTYMVDGGVHAGPNAVLALAREGYTWHKIVPKELLGALTWPGLWVLASKYIGPGLGEMVRSLSKTIFARSLAQLVPDIGERDLVKAPAGVRAQALRRDGGLVDDFLIQRSSRQVHVLNAPSPAATASLEIAAHVAREVHAALKD
jgi:L-2-hydroxyglutarate oxidase